MHSANTKKAYEFIRDKILEGVYPPGYRLQTVDVAKEIGVSRTPVRDALRVLQSEGLVTISPRLGASVRSLTSAEFREHCELRLALDSLAAELAARNRSPEDLLEIQIVVEAMDAAVKGLEAEPTSSSLRRELMRLDLRFHFAVLNAAHNNLVRTEIHRLHLLNRIVWTSVTKQLDNLVIDQEDQHRLEHIQEAHRRIYRAIKAQAPETARKAMHKHITEILELRMKTIAQLEKDRGLGEMESKDVADYEY